ncbi:MAG TPA: hypothetical protein VLD65_05725 [Anaerolineales bacterium]|nr:hypothetical protein [Anaerolineales bacterium]
MDASLVDLNEKMDALTAQVVYLKEQAQIAERQRQERSELGRDITPLANQAFNLVVEQLEEVQEYVDLGDLFRLFKRLLRNGRNMEKMLDQLESLADLLETVSPLADDAFGKAVDILAGLESKGYFSFARGSMHLMDHVVASFTEAELNHLGENITPMMSLVKQIDQSEILNSADHILAEIKTELAKPVDASYLGLLRQLRNPSVRSGLAITLRILQVIGSQATRQSMSE